MRVLTGAEEARYRALRASCRLPQPDGIVGDLGGGSLELVDIDAGASRRRDDAAARRAAAAGRLRRVTSQGPAQIADEPI